MGKLLSYSIVGGFIMLAMYLVYKLFIAGEKQHGFNRAVLLLVYPVSFCAYPLYNFVDSLTAEPAITPAIGIVEVEKMTAELASQPVWGTILIWIFLIGAAIVTARTIITWIRIVRVIHSGEKIKNNGYTLVVIDNDNIAPFSWLRYIVINRNDLNNNDSAITTHELKHIRSYHWFDLLIAQLVCIFNWFNPAAWLMRDELMLVHEYQADLAVIDTGHNPQEYQMLLIKKAVGSRFPSLANSINHSKLKKRITMMYKSKSGARSKLKALALVPMAALALGVASVPAVKAAVTTISSSEVSPDKGSENSQQSPQLKVISLNNSGNETTAVIRGENLGNYLSVSGVSFTNKGNVYTQKSLSTSMANGIATVTAVFPFADSYENASITLNINGKNVELNLDNDSENSTGGIAGIQSGTSEEFYECYPELQSEIMNNVKYPESLVKEDIQAMAVIQFTISAAGNLTDAKILKSSGYELFDAEALRAVNSVKKKWTPREHNGRAISVSYTMPFTFKTKSAVEDMEIYLDGKLISEEEMKALNPENIASISIDKQGSPNKMHITSK